MTATCWRCGGKGWVSDGQPEDGMMTGRMDCPVCDVGTVTDAQLLHHMERLLQSWKPDEVRP